MPQYDNSSQESTTQFIYNYAEEPSYYERKPRILNYLTYIEETTDKLGNHIFTRKRLKAAYKEVYMCIREMAGNRSCFRTEDYIANFVGCSPDTVREAKKVLSGPFEQLEGNSLITVTEKLTMTKRIDESGVEKNINKKPVHICGVNNIWGFNNSFMKTLSESDLPPSTKYLPPPMKQKLTLKEAELAIEKMVQKGAVEMVHNLDHLDVHNSGAHPKNSVSLEAYPKNRVSPQGGIPEKSGGHKTNKKHYTVKKKQTTDRAVQLSLINQDDVDCLLGSEAGRVKFLTELGYSQKVANELNYKYNSHVLTSSIYYLQKESEKKNIESITGYLLKILENEWWRPKSA